MAKKVFEGGLSSGGFHNNPQNINRKGRPKTKSVTDYLREYGDENYSDKVKIADVVSGSELIDEDGVYYLKVRLFAKNDKKNDKKKDKEECVFDIKSKKKVIKKRKKVKISDLFFEVKMPAFEKIAKLWLKDSRSKFPGVRMRSRETLTDRLEGKAKQSIDLDAKTVSTVDLSSYSTSSLESSLGEE